MVLKALELELALLAHTFATVLVCTPYLDCICVTHDGLGTTRESSMAARVFSSGHTFCLRSCFNFGYSIIHGFA